MAEGIIEVETRKGFLVFDFENDYGTFKVTGIDDENITSPEKFQKIKSDIKTALEQRYKELEESRNYDEWDEHGFSSAYDFYSFTY